VSYGLKVELSGMGRLQQVLDQLSNLQTRELLAQVGGIVESQTRERIAETKKDPDGMDWPEWSEAYAKTRGSQHSLLVNRGDLLDSIQFEVIDDHTAEVGSNLIYASAHQEGIGVPQRAFVGVNDENMDEIEKAVDDWLEDIL
jgi:phage virion morphogenesis protein